MLVLLQSADGPSLGNRTFDGSLQGAGLVMTVAENHYLPGSHHGTHMNEVFHPPLSETNRCLEYKSISTLPIFRYVQAGSEVSALMGRMPSAVGYQPTLANEVGALQERITSTKDGAITSVQAVYVPADDLTDPAPARCV